MTPAGSHTLPQRQFWAKTSQAWEEQRRAPRRYHPLLYHMLDVAAVAGLLWDDCLGTGLRKTLEASLGTPARTHAVFLAGAHDFGKASPGFQAKVPQLARPLKESGLRFSKNDQDRHHGFITARLLKEILGSAVLAQISGGHHGVFPISAHLRMGRDTLGGGAWEAARQELIQEFAQTVNFDLERAPRSIRDTTNPSVVPALAGLISVADWIGSNQDFFPCAAECGARPQSSPAEYWTNAQANARRALEALGWLPAVTFAAEARFDTVIRGFSPNATQTAVIELASKQTSPYLMIIEAPTGQGKTEAALYAADMAMCRGFARGTYIAMPTQATANAMFQRASGDYLKKRGHQGKLNLQLVHGDALLARKEAEPKEGEISGFEPKSIADEDAGDLAAQSWFTARKRPLLAPFGVGTIDQSLLSVLQTRHWFVRLFGLAGKVVIFDEVHAYDAYMSTILERLLNWLAEADCTVILLSATLPETKRKALAKAYSARADIEYQRYPRITLAGPHHYSGTQTDSPPACAEIPPEEPRTVEVSFVATGLPTLSAALNQQLAHGGCAAVICTTVDRSIEVYEHLRNNLNDTECLLFHARTLRIWRREREAEVLRKFGKGDRQADGTYTNPQRPRRAVLVATQVIEQSLDLDFDLMASEIAPVDLLLQRCGRLHRHPRQRPPGLEHPRLVVLCDADTAGPPPRSFGTNTEHVYHRYILLRTWLALRERDRLRLPTETESLVEAVYGQHDPSRRGDWNVALEQAKDEMQQSRSESQKAAARLLLPPPKSPSDLVEEFSNQLADDEDPEVHKTVRADTREGDPSITVVMLPPDMILSDHPGIPEVRSLLDHSAKLSDRGVVRALLDEGESPTEWTYNANLRHARLLRLDGQNQAHVGNYALTVNPELGVVIEREGDKNV